MKEFFGTLPSGQTASLYTISCGRVRAAVSDYGATLVSVWVDGTDVVLGYDDANAYRTSGGFLGATVGRNANRIGAGRFPMDGRMLQLPLNEGRNNLHSGPEPFSQRLWTVEEATDASLRLFLDSPEGDQGFPGHAEIRVTYRVENDGLSITYDAVCDKDTVFNMTNHAYFNLFGENHPDRAMDQLLTIPGSRFTVCDGESIPTGEMRCVEGTPFDFRTAKPLARDIGADYEPLHLQGGYDHNFEAASPICVILENPENGLRMSVSTDCPGVQIYAGNFLDQTGKQGRPYPKRSGVAIETQYYPDSVNHPEWPQPFVKANTPYHSVTRYQF